MVSPFEERLIVWTARLAVAFYVAAVALWTWPRWTGTLRSPVKRTRSGDIVWTLACAVFLLHVGLAFHCLHGWSHAAAFKHTADRTAEALGWRMGEGIYVNYLFLLWWLADVILLWARRDLRTTSYRLALHGFFAFILFNATIVFGPPWWRWTLLPLVPASIWLMFVSRRATSQLEGLAREK